MKTVRSYLVNCALACGVLYWAYDLSRSGRTLIDWTVLSIVGLAILWNLFKLGQRLYRANGGRDLWHLQRTLLLWIIGLLNTLPIRSAEIGSWKNLLGWAFLAAAAADSVALYRKERSSMTSDRATPAG